MKPAVKTLVTLCAVAAVIAVAALVAARVLGPRPAPVADPAVILTATVPQEGGTEPSALPSTPVLRNTSTDPNRLAIDFGYQVGGTAIPYRLALSFPQNTDAGTMEISSPRAVADAPHSIAVERHWSDTRHAYLVAIATALPGATPALPGLCVRAVIGPNAGRLELQQASLCAMQRDSDGACRPQTLACGRLQ